MSDHLEKAARAVLLDLDAVTALVGEKIRPFKLAEEDALPAIILETDEDRPVEDLSDDDPTEGIAKLNVVCVAYERQQARAIAEAVRTNGTDPETGLSGYRGAAGDLTFDPCTLLGTTSDVEASDDESDDGDWYLEVVQFEVWYRR
jgi:hypothetical protein